MTGIIFVGMYLLVMAKIPLLKYPYDKGISRCVQHKRNWPWPDLISEAFENVPSLDFGKQIKKGFDLWIDSFTIISLGKKSSVDSI